jgi:Na+/melibiose symporter-like transporter
MLANAVCRGANIVEIDLQPRDRDRVGIAAPGSEIGSIEPVERYGIISGKRAADRPTPAHIRSSLQASTLDGVFAAIFSNLTSGVLLSNFLVSLKIDAWEIGLVTAIPMLANFVQPVGAWLSDRFNSRRLYCTLVYLPARSIWLLLLAAIGWYLGGGIDAQTMTLLTMVIVALSHTIGGFGSAAWLSWMAILVPRQLRGRYFGWRNSAGNLTSSIVVILSGFWVANYPRGEVEAFAIALAVAIIAGATSMFCQWRMVDVNPQVWQAATNPAEESESVSAIEVILADRDFQKFLLYFSGWMFATNLSAPFFNLYLLQDLSIDVSWVTIYNSIATGANLLVLVPFGRWIDRAGYQLPLISVGALMAVLPLLWLGVGENNLWLWLGLPLLFLANGGACAAIDLCTNNLQLDIASERHHAKYFGIVAALGGICGAVGTIVGGVLLQVDFIGGLLGLFAISTVCRFLALIPILFLHPHQGQELPAGELTTDN